MIETGADFDLETVRLMMRAIFVVWVLLVVLTIRRTLSQDGIGLPTALVLTMSFTYGGAFVYALPSYTHDRIDGLLYLRVYDFTEWTVAQGTFVSVVGLLGLAIGAGALSPLRRRPRTPPVVVSRVQERNVLKVIGLIGLAAYVLHAANIRFPMSGALLEFGRNLAVVAVCLGGLLARRYGRPLWPWLMVAGMIPAYYMVLRGFASFAFFYAVVMTGFALAHLRRRRSGGLRMSLQASALVYLVLMGFIAWLSFRDELRDVVWRGAAGSPLDIMFTAFSGIEWLTPWNYPALDRLNTRFNLPIFIGKMMEMHEANPELRLWGATLVILPLVFVPRFIWPDKPVRGGSDFMAEHTGMFFSEGTTFGTGSIFEFYVNFGVPGVFLCCIVMGWLVRRIDLAAGRALARGDMMNFARWFVVGIVALDPLLRPFFIVNGAILAWLAITGLSLIMKRRSVRMPQPAKFQDRVT